MTTPAPMTVCLACGRQRPKDAMVQRPGKRPLCRSCVETAKARMKATK